MNGTIPTVGKFTVILPVQLIRKLKIRAIDEGKTGSQIVWEAINAYLEQNPRSEESNDAN